MKVLVVDGQGGGVGRALILAIREAKLELELLAVGTNAMATSALLKAGADAAATGENAVVFNAQRADIIVGPIGIISANALMGEITPSMAAAISESEATKLLLPTHQCHIHVVGVSAKPFAAQISDTVQELKSMLEHTPRP